MTETEVVFKLKQKVYDETKLGLEILRLLAEVFERKIHLKRGYPSLHEFCVKELKYTDGQTFRRIKAMQLLKSFPECEQKIEQGSLSLTNAASAQNYFIQNKITSVTEKAEILEKIENKSSELAAEKKKRFGEANPAAHLKTPVQSDPTHSDKNTFRPVIKRAASAPKLLPLTKTGRYIPVQVRQLIFSRDQCCTFIDPETKRRCESRWQLEIDHIQPYAQGGSNAADNL